MLQCKAYVLRLPRESKFEPRAVEVVHNESLELGVYRIHVCKNEQVPHIVESRHVTFDESAFPGAPTLQNWSDDEVEYNTSIDASIDALGSDGESGSSLDLSDDESEYYECSLDEATPLKKQSDSDQGSGRDIDQPDADEVFEEARDSTVHTTGTHSESTKTRRYPSRHQRKPQA